MKTTTVGKEWEKMVWNQLLFSFLILLKTLLQSTDLTFLIIYNFENGIISFL